MVYASISPADGRLSPDGKYLAGPWIAGSGNPAGIAVYDVVNASARLLTRDRGIWSTPFLSDSRRVMYFTTDGELVVVDVETGARRVIPVKLPLPAAPESIAIAPDARTVYYGAESIESNVWKVERR